MLKIKRFTELDLTGQGNVLQEAPFSGLNETPRPLPQPELAEPMPRATWI